ncbi:ferrous iron transport protein B [Mangrovibacterium lignilyticum]|uniref:ferrous iron transport protein B n=1 Tax=Mangrovibacterium lignilyticum TaxID=2668052 RepID=UPI0013D7A098|nr:ferrous iron transport protein B [Mangrovibacterium lignilyticum]
MSKQLKVALIGNPNTGKTSLFNQLTGLNQKVGNYPGITVDRKQGFCKLSDDVRASINDLPGTYSLNASSADEQIVVETLLNHEHPDFPEVAVVISDIENLKRNLLLFTQVKNMQIPTILVINMADQMERRGIKLNIPLLEEKLQTRIVVTSSRKGTGLEELKKQILDYKELPLKPCVEIEEINPAYFEKLETQFPDIDGYKLWLMLSQEMAYKNLDQKLREVHSRLPEISPSELKRLQQKETIRRYLVINSFFNEAYQVDKNAASDWRSAIDRILTHKIGGYVIFFLILLLIFQAIFNWSSMPMDLIDGLFASLSEYLNNNLPEGTLTSLLAEGVVPGVGGVVIFIPQIAFLFLFISILEESGYMSRIVFLMDRVMRRFGLSGKSVVPLISGTACSIPAVMATRNIENWKERLITILVTPFITCSARLPVYLIIISLVIPNQNFLGFNMQGLTLMVLYLLGFGMAVLSAAILNKILKIKGRSVFMVEMPAYKLPLPKNVLITVIEKTKSFVVGAGSIILALSIVLWFLASNGPSDDFKNATEIVTSQPASQHLSPDELNTAVSSYQLKHSYIGILGHAIEPAIRPLGYDWKMGIALISSFAAREVFVGTLATIYSVESDEEETIKTRMSQEINPDTGDKLFNFPTGISLLLFYAFALQCMSTVAIVKRETNGWKWPLIQLAFMSCFAYLCSLTAYQILS